MTDRRTDGRSDRQTDGIAIAYARLAYMLSRAMNMSIFRGSRIIVVSQSNHNCGVGLRKSNSTQQLSCTYNNCRRQSQEDKKVVNLLYLLEKLARRPTIF